MVKTRYKTAIKLKRRSITFLNITLCFAVSQQGPLTYKIADVNFTRTDTDHYK